MPRRRQVWRCLGGGAHASAWGIPQCSPSQHRPRGNCTGGLAPRTVWVTSESPLCRLLALHTHVGSLTRDTTCVCSPHVHTQIRARIPVAQVCDRPAPADSASYAAPVPLQRERTCNLILHCVRIISSTATPPPSATCPPIPPPSRRPTPEKGEGAALTADPIHSQQP